MRIEEIETALESYWTYLGIDDTRGITPSYDNNFTDFRIRQKLIDFCSSSTETSERFRSVISSILSDPSNSTTNALKSTVNHIVSFLLPDFKTREEIFSSLTSDTCSIESGIDTEPSTILFSTIFANFCHNLQTIPLDNETIQFAHNIHHSDNKIELLNQYFGHIIPTSHFPATINHFEPISFLVTSKSDINEYNGQFYMSSCLSNSDLFIKTDCPCFLLNIIDNDIAVCGGLVMKKPVISWLTPFISFSSINTMCKLLKSLQLAFVEMREYYSVENKRKLTVPLPCITRLETISGIVTWKYRYAIKSKKIVYKAILAKRPVIVKFVKKYGAAAHECMASAGFAPRLAHFANITKDWKIVIMEDLVDCMDLNTFKCKNPTKEPRLRDAVTFLHNNGFVHGDMRADNILFNSNGDVKILDWDWGGLVADYPRYPDDINLANIRWPEGVGPGAVITTKHDLYWIDLIIEETSSQCVDEAERIMEINV